MFFKPLDPTRYNPQKHSYGEGGIWTLAPISRPTPLAGAPLQPLEYFPKTKKYLILMGLNGLEPSTSRLSGVRSNQLSYRPFIKNKGKKAGDENRTRDNSLEGCGFTTKLHPH